MSWLSEVYDSNNIIDGTLKLLLVQFTVIIIILALCDQYPSKLQYYCIEGCGNCMHYYNLKFTPQFSILILVIHQVYSPSSYLRGFLRGQWLFPRESLQKLSNNRRHVLTSKHYLLGQGER